MVPTEFKKIKRDISERPDANNFFILCEGENTEPEFITKILRNADFIKNDGVSFEKVTKTENDRGVSNFDGLIKLANEVIENAKRENKYHKGDKVLVVFDLDVYYKTDKVQHIIDEMNKNKDKMIFAFTNPAIELFLLMCYSKDAYEKWIAPNKEKIVENEFVTSDDGKKRRYIADLFLKVTGIDSKVASADFSVFSKNIQFGINQEKIFLKQKISAKSNCLISNFGYVLESIKNNTYDSIVYSLDI